MDGICGAAEIQGGITEENARKCNFSGSSSPVTGGTIVQMALDHGWVPSAAMN